MKAVIWCAVSTQAQAAEDKISLPEQERAAREWCQENGYTVTHILKVEGYSRRESDILTALDDFAAQGVDAYHRLRELWQQKAFDVLVAYTHSRFGRSSTLHAWVIENVINSGANIYLLQGGWVKPSDFRFQIALGGVTATADIDRLVKAHDLAMDKRAEQGLPTSTIVPMSHKLVRDERGKAVRLEVNEDLRRMWDDLAELMAQGVGYKSLPAELAARGHLNSRGEPHILSIFHKLLYLPTFWGHSARHYWKQPKELWRIQPGHPIPDGVIIHYNTHEPVYTGDQAQTVIAEIKRRKEAIKGRATPQTTTRFRGIAICGECLRTMTISHPDRARPLLRCGLRNTFGPSGKAENYCSQSRSIWVGDVQAYFDKMLRLMIDEGTPDLFEQHSRNGNRDKKQSQIHILQKDLVKIEDELRGLIVQEATADESLRVIYTEEISWRTDKLKVLRAELDQRTLHAQVSHNITEERRQGYKVLRSMSVEEFWELPNRQINQVLHQLLGDVRLVILDGKVIGLAKNR